MKKRFFLMVLTSVCILWSMPINSAHAVEGWYPDCDIVQTGSQDGLAIVYLKGGPASLPANWYTLGYSSTQSNQLLAVVLTCISTGVSKMGVTVDPTVGTWPVVRTAVIVPNF